MQHKRMILGALALVLSLCFISSAMVINSGDDGCNQDITLGVPGYDVYLEKNGGVGDDYYFVYPPTPYAWGSNMVPSPTKDGYIFAGWYYDKELTVSIDEGNDSITGLNYNYFPDSPGTGVNTTIYAKWVKTPTDGTVLSDDGNRLIIAPSDAVNYVIPDGVTTIAGYAFFKCNNMQSIKFPESVTTLEAHTFDGLGLITVYIPHSATYMDQVPPFFNIIRTYPAPTADNYSSHNTFEIRTPDDLKIFSLSSNISGNTYEGKTVYLVNNLDMTNVSMGSIGGRSDSQFKGTFDGQGHVISNLEISMEGGLFYYIGTGGLVKNLGLYNCYMRGEGLQNSVFASENYGTIRNCYANACSVSWGGIDSGGAGFVCSNYGSIENCYSNTSCLKDYNTLCADNNGTVTNSYYLRGSWQPNKIGVAKTAEEMKDPNFATLLGRAFAPDTANVNGGYPILAPVSTEFTVSFETNGGSEVASQTVNEGENAVRPADPTKQGYVFGGWYSNAELTTEYTFTTPVTENITLYAKWYEDVIFTSVPSVSDITATVDGRTVNVQVKAQNYAKFLWDMGDGSDLITTYQPNVTYTYDKGGDYKVTATAINDVGESEPIVQNVAISDDNNNSENEANCYWIIGIILAIIIAVVVIGVIKS